MDVVQFLVVLALLAAVVLVVSAPLRRPRRDDASADAKVGALEAAKQAKYREIRDAEMDRRTGKLSQDDWRALDAQLRAEAMEILRRLDGADS